MKLVTVIGARPQFIKAAPFSEIFRKNNIEILIHTGQHYDENMSDVFFKELNIPKPDYNLAVGSGTHGKQTAKMLKGIEEILLKEKPQALMVYGDTNSTLAGALAAGKLNIPIIHVEAGLRGYNKIIPEEQNRLVTDHLSDLLFCPTMTAVKNLKKEGITEGVIFCGDIMYDAVKKYINTSKSKYKNGYWLEEIANINDYKPNITENNYYLATIHRAENTDSLERLKIIFDALNKLDKPILLPLHPRTKNIISDMKISLKNINIIKPVGYLLMLYLTANARMVITDSGGLQKEAYFLQTPCTTLRDSKVSAKAEWIETHINDWNVRAEIENNSIINAAMRNFNTNTLQVNAFGNGTAAQQICKAIEGYIK